MSLASLSISIIKSIASGDATTGLQCKTSVIWARQVAAFNEVSGSFVCLPNFTIVSIISVSIEWFFNHSDLCAFSTTTFSSFLVSVTLSIFVEDGCQSIHLRIY